MRICARIQARSKPDHERIGFQQRLHKHPTAGAGTAIAHKMHAAFVKMPRCRDLFVRLIQRHVRCLTGRINTAPLELTPGLIRLGHYVAGLPVNAAKTATPSLYATAAFCAASGQLAMTTVQSVASGLRATQAAIAPAASAPMPQAPDPAEIAKAEPAIW